MCWQSWPNEICQDAHFCPSQKVADYISLLYVLAPTLESMSGIGMSNHAILVRLQ